MLSSSQLAVAIKGLSPVAPMILTTVPLFNCPPVVFFTLTIISLALIAKEAVSAYRDEDTAIDDVTDELINPKSAICCEPEIVPAGNTLPLASGINTPNVVPSPLVNVIVCAAYDAVTKDDAVIADVTQLPLCASIESNLWSADAVNASIESNLLSADVVKSLKEEVNVYLFKVVWSTCASIVAIPAITVAVIPEPVKFNAVAVPCRIPSSKIVVATDAVMPVN